MWDQVTLSVELFEVKVERLLHQARCGQLQMAWCSKFDGIQWLKFGQQKCFGSEVNIGILIAGWVLALTNCFIGFLRISRSGLRYSSYTQIFVGSQEFSFLKGCAATTSFQSSLQAPNLTSVKHTQILDFQTTSIVIWTCETWTIWSRVTLVSLISFFRYILAPLDFLVLNDI